MVFTVKWFQILLIVLLCLTKLSVATVVQSVDIEEMLIDSELVFEGRVIGQRVEAGTGKRHIHTWLKFEISDVIKGDYTEQTIELKFLGGTIGGNSLSVGNMHLPAFGEKGIYFVEQLKQLQVHPLYGWSQGHFIIELDQNTRKEQVKTRHLKPVYGVTSKIKGKSASSLFNPETAQGVRTEAIQDNAQPLSPSQFKKWLRQLIISEGD